MPERKILNKITGNSLLDRLRGRLRCTIGLHEPHRRKVKRVGMTYVGFCCRCGIAIQKHNGRSWEPVNRAPGEDDD